MHAPPLSHPFLEPGSLDIPADLTILPPCLSSHPCNLAFPFTLRRSFPEGIELTVPASTRALARRLVSILPFRLLPRRRANRRDVNFQQTCLRSLSRWPSVLWLGRADRKLTARLPIPGRSPTCSVDRCLIAPLPDLERCRSNLLHSHTASNRTVCARDSAPTWSKMSKVARGIGRTTRRRLLRRFPSR